MTTLTEPSVTKKHKPTSVLTTATKTVKPGAVATPDDRTLLEEAESLRDSLRISLNQINTLLRSLKQQTHRNRKLRSTLASLKQLQSLEA